MITSTHSNRKLEKSLQHMRSCKNTKESTNKLINIPSLTQQKTVPAQSSAGELFNQLFTQACNDESKLRTISSK